jgi:hypothetical protein
VIIGEFLSHALSAAGCLLVLVINLLYAESWAEQMEHQTA